MNAQRIAAFWAAYFAALAADVEKNPKAYALRSGETAADYAQATAGKMRAAVETPSIGIGGAMHGPDFGRVNYSQSRNFKAAAKALGLPFNRAGLNSLYKEEGKT